MSSKSEQPDRPNILPDDFPVVDSYQDWQKLTPEQKELFETIGDRYPFNDPEALTEIFENMANKEEDERWRESHGE